MDIESIRKNIRKYRMLRGYSQEYMAHRLNISQFAYHKIESGRTTLKVSVLIKIGKILDIDSEKLIKNAT